MKKSSLIFTILFISGIGISCQSVPQSEIEQITADSPTITGPQEYLDSPYVTAGNRVYMVGHQNGTFPPLGWHIPGEMGGIWNHPIKLMDGFSTTLAFSDGTEITIDDATSFTNYPYANRLNFDLSELELSVQQWNYVPDDLEGIIIEYVFKNLSDAEISFDLIFEATSDLSPTWLGERTEMEDGPDEFQQFDDDGWMFKDSINPWYTIFDSEIEANEGEWKTNYPESNTSIGTKRYTGITIQSNEVYTQKFFIAGSYNNEEELLTTLENLKANPYGLLIAKKKRYEQLQEQSKLTVPDKELQETFEWLKYNSDWLVRTIPELGTAIGAGIPDYPWLFGVDSEYSLQGYQMIGQDEVVNSTIAMIDSVSRVTNGNGRIIHEMSTNGAVFNPGNINETPQWATLIWEIYKWNGDREFIETYFPQVEQGLEWLLAENDADGNLFPEGYGMMEIHGLSSEMIDVASYTQKAFVDAAFMADELGKIELAANYREKASELAQKINVEFWSEEFGSYADFISTDEKALHLIDDAIVRADTLGKPWAVEELRATKQAILDNPSDEERPFVVHHNWVVNTPMEVGLADPEKALIALETAENYVNPFGMFVTGIDRDESAGSDDGSFAGTKQFSYVGAVMTLPTGVQVIAENNYGRPDQALNYLQRMVRSFSYALPGSMYEVSPDYGMMVQAWNIYSFAVPITRQFFGIDPMASENTIYLSPLMPSQWDEASLENVKIGEDTFSFYFSKSGEQNSIKVEQHGELWDVVFMNGDEPITLNTETATFSW